LHKQKTMRLFRSGRASGIRAVYLMNELFEQPSQQVLHVEKLKKELKDKV